MFLSLLYFLSLIFIILYTIFRFILIIVVIYSYKYTLIYIFFIYSLMCENSVLDDTLFMSFLFQNCKDTFLGCKGTKVRK